MNSSIHKLKFGWVALLLSATTAFAVAVPLDINPTQSQPANNGSGTVTTWLNGLITTYNTNNNPDLPSPATLTFDSNVDPMMPGYPPNTGTSVVMPMGTYEYLVLKWGGSGPGTYGAYYIGGMTGVWTFNAPGQNALSGYRLYDAPTTPPPSVPDGGIGVMVLGAALGLLGLIRRWI